MQTQMTDCMVCSGRTRLPLLSRFKDGGGGTSIRQNSESWLCACCAQLRGCERHRDIIVDCNEGL